MIKYLILAAIGVGIAAPARSEILFNYTFDGDATGVFKPKNLDATQTAGQSFYLPLGPSTDFVISDNQKIFKTKFLTAVRNPKSSYDAIGFTTPLFTLSKWKSYIVGWEGVFWTGGSKAKQTVSFGLSMGHYVPLGGVTAKDGMLYLETGKGKQKFATYKPDIPHGFIYTLDVSKPVKRVRVTFAQSGALQSSSWTDIPEVTKVPDDANYMTMTLLLPDAAKKDDTSIYFLDKISINGNFPR